MACLQEKYDGRRLLIRKQGDTITGINRHGLVVAIPEPIREAVEHIPFDVLIDGEAVGDTLHAFDLLEVKGNDLRQRRYPGWNNTSGCSNLDGARKSTKPTNLLRIHGLACCLVRTFAGLAVQVLGAG